MDDPLGFAVMGERRRNRDFLVPAATAPRFKVENTEKAQLSAMHINANLLEAFKTELKRKSPNLSMAQAISHYMAYVIGADCKDSPYVNSTDEAAIKAYEETHHSTPQHYWKDPPPQFRLAE